MLSMVLQRSACLLVVPCILGAEHVHARSASGFLARNTSLKASSGNANVDVSLCYDNGACGDQCCYEDRPYEIPEGIWSSTCDTLGDVFHNLGHAPTINKLYTSGLDAVQVQLFNSMYCTGDPLMMNEAGSDGNGIFYTNGGEDGWYSLGSDVEVWSVRVTAAGPTRNPAEDYTIGAKLVLFPLYNQDNDLDIAWDEFNPDRSGCHGVDVNSAGANFPDNGCVSPDDRVYCLPYPGNDGGAWGIMDPLNNMDFADKEVPEFDGSSALGFPVGSYYFGPYTTSWTDSPPCNGNQYEIDWSKFFTWTKMYSDTCDDVKANCPTDPTDCWDNYPNVAEFTLGQSENMGTWPTGVKCVWTRVLDK